MQSFSKVIFVSNFHDLILYYNLQLVKRNTEIRIRKHGNLMCYMIIGVANVDCGGYPLRCLLATFSRTVGVQFFRRGTLARFMVSTIRQDAYLCQFSHQSIFV